MEKSQSVKHSPEVGEQVYDGNGHLLGRVSGLNDEGFEIEFPAPGNNGLEEIPGQEFGEGYLMWRCGDCGEMRELDGELPESCAACGAAREALVVVEED